MEKLYAYQGWIGRIHEWRESLRERYHNWRQENPETVIELLQNQVYGEPTEHSDADYSHVYRFLIFGIYMFFQITFIYLYTYLDYSINQVN